MTLVHNLIFICKLLNQQLCLQIYIIYCRTTHGAETTRHLTFNGYQFLRQFTNFVFLLQKKQSRDVLCCDKR
jgi:hypothetical protein